ncbi:MAG: hypothetical protein NTZ85_02490, partial [Bacteroidia bacterium]|nr:hypothetical protein [Bacteroidia bacterium]
MKKYMNIKILSLLSGMFFLQIHLSFSNQSYNNSDSFEKLITYSNDQSSQFLVKRTQSTNDFYPVHFQTKTEGIILSDTLKILWISPSKKTTVLKSASAKIRVAIKSPSGLRLAVIYLNDVLYGEPEMNPSVTELGSYLL